MRCRQEREQRVAYDERWRDRYREEEIADGFWNDAPVAEEETDDLPF